MIELALLGIGGGMPMPGRYLSSLLINYKGRKILLDCGEGTQVSMREFSRGFKTLDLILITHTHGDHINGLVGLLATLGNSERKDKVTIIGPEGITKVMEAFKILIPYLPYPIEVIEVKENQDFSYRFMDINIEAIYVEHSSPCMAYNFFIARRREFIREKAEELNIPKEMWGLLQKGDKVNIVDRIVDSNLVLGPERGGIKFSYVTDTRPIEKIKDFIKDSDVFFCEGTYESVDKLDKALKNYHMTFEEAATLAKEGEVKKLVLTHFSPSIINPEDFIENAKNIFENSFIGKEREVISLKFSEDK